MKFAPVALLELYSLLLQMLSTYRTEVSMTTIFVDTPLNASVHSRNVVPHPETTPIFT